MGIKGNGVGTIITGNSGLAVRNGIINQTKIKPRKLTADRGYDINYD
jgi:hypothetical protein